MSQCSIGESCSHKVHEGCARAALTTQATLSPSERSYSSIRINSDGSGAGHLELKERIAAGEMGGLKVGGAEVHLRLSTYGTNRGWTRLYKIRLLSCHRPPRSCLNVTNLTRTNGGPAPALCLCRAAGAQWDQRWRCGLRCSSSGGGGAKASRRSCILW